MIIELTGGGCINRGAELMACAVATELRKRFKDVRIGVPADFGSFGERARYGFEIVPDFRRRFQSPVFRFALRWLGHRGRAGLGVILPEEVDAVIDISGFAFSDQWGPLPARRLLQLIRRLDPHKSKVIFMPQALGPFENPEVHAAVKELLDRGSLVCPRDAVSKRHLDSLGVSCEAFVCPDFTVALKGEQPVGLETPNGFVAIVPNYRMLDKAENSGVYLSAIEQMIRMAQDAGRDVVFVLHDAIEDVKVVDRLAKDESIQIFRHPDPRVLKGFLGKAHVVVGSRFHALVGALSQGVPVLALGWSHKYEELLRDFGVVDECFGDLREVAIVFEKYNALLGSEFRREVSMKLEEGGASVRGRVEELWKRVSTMLTS